MHGKFSYAQHPSDLSLCKPDLVSKQPQKAMLNQELLKVLKGDRTSKVFAKEMGVDNSMVTRWEKGNIPNGENFEKFCVKSGRAPSSWLGRSAHQVRAYTIDVVRHEIGIEEAELLELYSRMSERDRKLMLTTARAMVPEAPEIPPHVPSLEPFLDDEGGPSEPPVAGLKPRGKKPSHGVRKPR